MAQCYIRASHSHKYIMYIEHASLHLPSCLPLPISLLCSLSQCHLHFYAIYGTWEEKGTLSPFLLEASCQLRVEIVNNILGEGYLHRDNLTVAIQIRKFK